MAGIAFPDWPGTLDTLDKMPSWEQYVCIIFSDGKRSTPWLSAGNGTLEIYANGGPRGQEDGWVLSYPEDGKARIDVSRNGDLGGPIIDVSTGIPELDYENPMVVRLTQKVAMACAYADITNLSQERKDAVAEAFGASWSDEVARAAAVYYGIGGLVDGLWENSYFAPGLVLPEDKNSDFWLALGVISPESTDSGLQMNNAMPYGYRRTPELGDMLQPMGPYSGASSGQLIVIEDDGSITLAKPLAGPDGENIPFGETPLPKSRVLHMETFTPVLRKMNGLAELKSMGVDNGYGELSHRSGDNASNVYLDDTHPPSGGTEEGVTYWNGLPEIIPLDSSGNPTDGQTIRWGTMTSDGKINLKAIAGQHGEVSEALQAYVLDWGECTLPDLEPGESWDNVWVLRIPAQEAQRDLSSIRSLYPGKEILNIRAGETMQLVGVWYYGGFGSYPRAWSSTRHWYRPDAYRLWNAEPGPYPNPIDQYNMDRAALWTQNPQPTASQMQYLRMPNESSSGRYRFNWLTDYPDLAQQWGFVSFRNDSNPLPSWSNSEVGWYSGQGIRGSMRWHLRGNLASTTIHQHFKVLREMSLSLIKFESDQYDVLGKEHGETNGPDIERSGLLDHLPSDIFDSYKYTVVAIYLEGKGTAIPDAPPWRDFQIVGPTVLPPSRIAMGAATTGIVRH